MRAAVARRRSSGAARPSALLGRRDGLAHTRHAGVRSPYQDSPLAGSAHPADGAERLRGAPELLGHQLDRFVSRSRDGRHGTAG